MKKIWMLFEQPSPTLAKFIHGLIVILILLSAGLAIVSLAGVSTPENLIIYIDLFESIVLAIFTIELLLRIVSAPSKITFIKDPFNWIDALAVVPFYFGIENAIILRIFRLLRLLRIVKSLRLLGISDVIVVRGTIMQIVGPLVLGLVALKLFVWLLEAKGLWFSSTDLDTIFTIIGFALGIVLSQKIGTTYGKYLEIEDRLFGLHGKISSLKANLVKMGGGIGVDIIRDWINDFVRLYHGEKEGGVRGIHKANERMYEQVSKFGNTELLPFHRISAMMKEVFEDSFYVLSKRTALTPRAYDSLLKQSTVLYLLLLIAFIPGIRGVLAVAFATYLLYGMYYITRDLDTVAGSFDDNRESLIYLRVDRLEWYLSELDKETV